MCFAVIHVTFDEVFQVLRVIVFYRILRDGGSLSCESRFAVRIV